MVKRRFSSFFSLKKEKKLGGGGTSIFIKFHFPRTFGNCERNLKSRSKLLNKRRKASQRVLTIQLRNNFLDLSSRLERRAVQVVRLKSSRCGQKARCITVSGRRPIVPRDTLFNYGAKRCRAGRRRAIFSSPRRVSTRGRDRELPSIGGIFVSSSSSVLEPIRTGWTPDGRNQGRYIEFMLPSFSKNLEIVVFGFPNVTRPLSEMSR